MLEINIQKGYSDDDLDLIVATLKKGGVVVLPTDTIYGLHCLADNEKAIKKIIKIKERPQNFGFVHLMKSYCMLHDYAYVSKKQDKYLRTVWPATTQKLQNFKVNPPAARLKIRPTTVVLKSREKLPSLGRGGLDSIAVRLPRHELLIKILKTVNIPLISSSLNISGSGQVSLKRIKDVFKIQPDLIVNDGILAKKCASRLLDVVNVDKIKVIRM